jgi:integrase
MKAFIGTELLRKLPAAPCEVRDSKLPGFVLRVRPSGNHSYLVSYKRGSWHVLGSTKVLSAPEAREQARQVLADAAKGADPVAAKRKAKKDIAFEAFIDQHYQPWAEAQRKTGAEQTQRLRQVFGAALNALRLSEINSFVVERWRSARLKDGIAATTVNRDLSTLRGALSRALEWDLIAAHPLAKVKASKIDRRGGIVRYLSAEEETRLMAALSARDDRRRAERDSANRWREQRGYKLWSPFGIYSDHLTPLVTTALHTGLRRGELFGLRWRDVDLVAARLTVRGEEAKSAQTRHVPLNATAAAALKTWHADSEEPEASACVFPGDDGAPLTDIKGSWGKALKAAEVQNFRFHDCRHTFASKLVMAGVDLNTVRELLGHADIKQVLRYAHLAPEHMSAAVAKLVAANR